MAYHRVNCLCTNSDNQNPSPSPTFMPSSHPNPQNLVDGDASTPMPKFEYLTHITNLINSISLIHTSIFRFCQYVTEVQITKFKDLRKCVKRVPIVKNKDLWNALKHIVFLTTDVWDKFHAEMSELTVVDMPNQNTEAHSSKHHPMESYDRKYILSKYELTYQQLKNAKNELSRIIQTNQIVIAFHPNIIQNWSGFIAKAPKIIETTYAYWPHIVPQLKIAPSLRERELEEVGCSPSWVYQLEFLTEIIEKVPSCFMFPALPGHESDSDSGSDDDSECGWDPPTEERIRIMKALR